jgi:hypothetical protein
VMRAAGRSFELLKLRDQKTVSLASQIAAADNAVQQISTSFLWQPTHGRNVGQVGSQVAPAFSHATR